jgi:hypothetical protein
MDVEEMVALSVKHNVPIYTCAVIRHRWRRSGRLEPRRFRLLMSGRY